MSKAGAKGKAQAQAAVPKVFLKVPFADKDVVKGLGAYWSVPDKLWYVPPFLVKDASKMVAFAKWVLPPTAALPTTTPANKGKLPNVTPAVASSQGSLSQQQQQASTAPANDNKKRPYSLITPAASQPAETEEAPEPIPVYLHYKLKLQSTSELAKILIGLGVKIPIGLDVDELIELMQQNPELVTIDMSPPPPVVFKQARQQSEHELIMAALKAKRAAEIKMKKDAECIAPEITRGPAKPKKTKREGGGEGDGDEQSSSSSPAAKAAIHETDDPLSIFGDD